MPESQAKAQ